MGEKKAWYLGAMFKTGQFNYKLSETGKQGDLMGGGTVSYTHLDVYKRQVEGLKAKGISVKYDDADNKRPGFKFADYELKGVPVRLVIGPKDLEEDVYKRQI